VRFILYYLYLLNINCNGMTLDGTQIVNSRVSYTHQRKKFPIMRQSYKSEEQYEIGCLDISLLSLIQ
jgi:hypothetical protein